MKLEERITQLEANLNVTGGELYKRDADIGNELAELIRNLDQRVEELEDWIKHIVESLHRIGQAPTTASSDS